MSEEVNTPTPGWNAISRVFDKLYPQQQPQHWGTIIKWCLGGDDPLDGMSAYKADEPIPHWHFVSYGMSELYLKESENKDWSGWGFEFTFRLARKKSEKSPPTWALSLLQNLARYVWKTGNTFAANHYIPLNGPIAHGTDTQIRAVCFIRDPQTKLLNTPNGKLDFLQIVGLTDDELDASMSWNVTEVLKLLKKQNSRFITDIQRESMLKQPAIAKKIAAGIARDGSNVSGTSLGTLRWAKSGTSFQVTIGEIARDSIVRFLEGRTLFEREFDLVGPQQRVRFVPEKRTGYKVTGDELTVKLTRSVAEEMLATLKESDQPGEYRWPSFKNFTLNVEPTKLTDTLGKPISKS